MDNELNNIVSSEYFYLETDMAFMRRKAFVFDKFIIVFVEKGTARVAVGDDEYHIDSYRMLVLRPDFYAACPFVGGVQGGAYGFYACHAA